MKKCPYCAEEIQDDAIKCRYCYSDLTVPREEAMAQRPEPSTPAVATASGTAGSETQEAGPAPASPSSPSSTTTGSAGSGTGSTETDAGEPTAPAAAETGDASVRYSHSGYRYVLGYDPDHFGIWDRQSPSKPTETFPRTDEGWRNAWLRFVALEPKHVEVPAAGPTPTTHEAPAAEATSSDDAEAAKYTHTGTRYLLGYGASFFGIWDRQNPAVPVERFPRTDEGWAQAWRRYTQIETNFTEVPKD